ncbi:MAG: hypothetical protein ABFE02_06155 [Sulfuricella sp.]
MRSALHVITMAALIPGLAACAAPRYQSAYRYEPPTGMDGHACLEACTRKIAVCRGQCAATSQACLKNLAPLVDERYNADVKRYEAELGRYRQELLQYDLYLSLNWGYPYPWHHGMWPYSPWEMPYSSPPIPPVKPSRSAEFERLRGERCDVDCGCQSIYDACFLACGGKKIPEVKCISHCPP